jgi:hypothetical protein
LNPNPGGVSAPSGGDLESKRVTAEREAQKKAEGSICG